MKIIKREEGLITLRLSEGEAKDLIKDIDSIMPYIRDHNGAARQYYSNSPEYVIYWLSQLKDTLSK